MVKHICYCALDTEINFYQHHCLLACNTVSNVILKSVNNLTLFSAAEQVCVSHSLQANFFGCTILFHPCIPEWAGDIISVNYINTRIQTTCFHLSSGCYFVPVFVVRRDGLLDSSPAITNAFMVQKTVSGTLLIV